MFPTKPNQSQRVSILTLLCLLIASAVLMVHGVTSAHTPDPTSVIRMTPPAPVIDEKAWHTELAARRARVMQALGGKAMLVLFSAEPRLYTHDVDYEYRQENNLFYLTNLNQKRATLVLWPGANGPESILFLPRRSAFAETWNGHMYTAEEARQLSGLTEIWEASEFEPFMRAVRGRTAYRPEARNILMSQGAGDAASAAMSKLFESSSKNEGEIYLLAPTGDGESREYRQEQRFAAEWSKSPSGFGVKNATPVFADLRLRKSPIEVAMMQHAIDITSEAHQRAWAAAGEAKWEYEVDAQVAYTFKLRNADHWGYPSIVGCGPNATTLHYVESQGKVNSGELMLMDVGAEYQHYTADVTRTFPVNGKFSPAQAEIYQIVFDAQEAAAKASKPGALISDVNRAATEVIKAGLLKLGLITDRDSGQYRTWFMHGTSHWLGMNVHDVGNYGARLEPGMIFTNEPGIYIRLDALDNLPQSPENQKFIAAVRPAFEKYKGIGVRIEDDMLITSDGVKWMTEALPRRLTDIEAFIARARSK